MIQAGLVSYLLADTTLRGLIGNRIYGLLMPENASVFPVIVYQDVSMATDVNLDLSAVVNKRIQFDIRGKAYPDVKNVQARLHTLLDGYTGALPDGTQVIFCEAGNDIDEYDKDALVYQAISDFIFSF